MYFGNCINYFVTAFFFFFFFVNTVKYSSHPDMARFLNMYIQVALVVVYVLLADLGMILVSFISILVKYISRV